MGASLENWKPAGKRLGRTQRAAFKQQTASKNRQCFNKVIGIPGTAITSLMTPRRGSNTNSQYDTYFSAVCFSYITAFLRLAFASGQREFPGLHISCKIKHSYKTVEIAAWGDRFIYKTGTAFAIGLVSRWRYLSSKWTNIFVKVRGNHQNETYNTCKK